MSTRFGPMSSSPDGIDRVEIRVGFRLSRENIVNIFAYEYEPKSKPTKAEVYESVVKFLRVHGIETVLGGVTPWLNWNERRAWANEYIAKLFPGWSE